MKALGIIFFAATILFSIGLHEFGHFISAKKFGIKVEQFFLGFGPTLWSMRRGETEYGVKALPLGGFVRITGMNPLEEIAEEDRDRVFQSKKPWKRAIVLAAGSFTHFVLAFVIVVGINMVVGQPNPEQPTTEIAAVAQTHAGGVAPAKAAGLREGDRVVSVDGRRITRWSDFTSYVRANPGNVITIVVQRDGRQVTLTPVRTAEQNNAGDKVGYLGVSPVPTYESMGPLESVGGAGRFVFLAGRESLVGIKRMFEPSTLGRLFRVATNDEKRTVEDPGTLVGISAQAGNLARSGDFETFFLLIAVLNIFIGVVNLLPLPPLDGGHLAVLAWEKISRKPVDMRKLLPLTATVVAIFGSLFILLLFLDIARPMPSIG